MKTTERTLTGQVSLWLAVLLTLMMASPRGMWAQTDTPAPGPAGPPNPQINRTELNNFDRFLDTHPWDRKAISQNPSLLNNPQFLSTHPHLQTFLNNHPGVSRQVQLNPNRFVNHEKMFERRGEDINRGELARFDRQYLDKHPQVARQLNRNPRLVDNPQFMQKHPGLQRYFKNHPEIRQDIREHPYAFRNRERQYERQENRRAAGFKNPRNR
jgi:hypothetical protein